MPPAERIATFDNDGTLWWRSPLYIQACTHSALGQMAAKDPDSGPPAVQGRYEKDKAWVGRGHRRLCHADSSAYRLPAEGFAAGLDGSTGRGLRGRRPGVPEHRADARFGRPYTQLTYRPMVELVHYLQSAEFDVYLSSGLGRDFMRAVCEEIYGIPRAMAIGSSVTFEYVEDAQGVAQVVRTRRSSNPRTTGPASRSHIHVPSGVGRSWPPATPSGDVYMLKYATGHQGRTLGLLVHHDDVGREYAYDGGAEEALRLAETEGWVVVSMKDDWKTIFA